MTDHTVTTRTWAVIHAPATWAVLDPGQKLTTTHPVNLYSDRATAIAAMRDLTGDPAWEPDDDPPAPPGPSLDTQVADLHALTAATRTAARLTVSGQITDGTLDDDTVASLAPLYPSWRPDEAVTVGDLREWDGTVVECLQGHTTQADWTPDATPALWKIHRTTTGDTPDEWVQPTGGHDAYSAGDRVTFDGAVYESLIDGNTWSPADYPAGWQRID